jgi:hypothetical protein
VTTFGQTGSIGCLRHEQIRDVAAEAVSQALNRSQSNVLRTRFQASTAYWMSPRSTSAALLTL